MRRPLVTVILPGKDVAPFIGTTLTTLARQFDDRSALKLVAIDDGSSDDTGALMRHFGEAFDHVELLRNDAPVGLASARNQGLAHVDTDYFCFVDGDDWMQPGRLTALADALRRLACDFVRTDHVTDTEGRRRLVRAPFAWRGRVVSPRDAILPADDSTMVDYPYAWAGMFHRRVLDRGLAYFPDGLFTAEDRPWIWRLHLQASSFAVVDAPALLYRRGIDTSLTQIFDRRQLDVIPAFAQVIATVDADADADRLRPKVVATTLAVSAHHLFRARHMRRALRVELRDGVRGLVASLPANEVAEAYARMSDRRRRVLAGVVREAVRA